MPTTSPATRKTQNEIQPMRYQWLPKGQPPGRKRFRGITALRTNASKMRTAVKIDKFLGPVCIDSVPSLAKVNYKQAMYWIIYHSVQNTGNQTEFMPTLNLIQDVMK